MNRKEEKIAIRPIAEMKRTYIAVGVVLILFVASSVITDYRPWDLLTNMENFWLFIFNDLTPPKLADPYSIMKGLLETISMAFCATLFASIIAAIMALLGSSATCPWKPLRKIIRGIASLQRNIPNLIWTFILIMSFGIGNVVGMLALLIQSTGFLARAFIETLDEIGEESIEAMKAVGAGKATISTQALIPACMEGIISWILYGLEVNIRSSTLVGAVGGGGIGLVMTGYIKLFRYHSAMGVILLIAAVVIIVDMLTNFLRKKVLV